MFSPTRNSVVKSSMVGKEEKSSAVFTYMDIMSMRNDNVMFTPMSVSTRGVGRGTIISATTTTSSMTMVMSLWRVMRPTPRDAFSIKLMPSSLLRQGTDTRQEMRGLPPCGLPARAPAPS